MVFGVYEGDSLIGNWRIRTEKDRTADEYVGADGCTSSPGQSGSRFHWRSRYFVRGTAHAEQPGTVLLDLLFGVNPLIVEPGIKTKMPIRIDSPKEVGADRLVNALAAYERYKCSLIVVDFGTATTFDGVSAKGEYLGGSIAPGVMISCEALFQRASKLPRVEIFSHPKAALGKDTVSAMSFGHHIRLCGHGRGHCQTHEDGNTTDSQSRCHRGVGEDPGSRVRLYRRNRGIPDSRRTSHYLRTESMSRGTAPSAGSRLSASSGRARRAPTAPRPDPLPVGWS